MSRRRRVTFAAREPPLPRRGAGWPPRRRLGKRRGPAPGAAPGSVPPAASRLGRWRPAAAPVAEQMQVAGERVVFGPFDLSIRAKRKTATTSERRAEDARSRPSLPAQGGCRILTQARTAREDACCRPAYDPALQPRLACGIPRRPRGPLSRVGGFPGAACERPMSSLSLPTLICDYLVSRAGSTPPVP